MAPSAVSPDTPAAKLAGLKLSRTNDASTLADKLSLLRPQLSPKATVELEGEAGFAQRTARWSCHNPPLPGAVVNVACEEDICSTIQFCRTNNIKFLAQSGAHAFTSSISALSRRGIIINLRALNAVTVDHSSMTAKISAGTLTNEVLDAAAEAKVHIMTGVCNTVGIIPAFLGGGMGMQASLYGMGVDNILSARLATADGKVVIVSAEENKELFWGLRGAGHNFGIVSELTVKAHPQINEGMHWTYMLMFPGTEDIVKKVAEAVMEMGIGKGMGLGMVFARVPPAFQPTIILNLWYAGSEAEGKDKFKSLFTLSPAMEMGGPTPYGIELNTANDMGCLKGGRKPIFSVGLKDGQLDRIVGAFTEWNAFTTAYPSAGASVILVECYGMEVVRSVPSESTAYPWRGASVHVVGNLNYGNVALDVEACEAGERIRKSLTEEKSARMTYMNFANGDEKPEILYGGKERLEKLKGLKEKWDPEGAFSLYNPVC